MTTKLAVTSVKVLDQEEALDFYVNKLGMEKGQDIRQGSFRWLTVRFPDDPERRDLPGGARTARAR